MTDFCDDLAPRIVEELCFDCASGVVWLTHFLMRKFAVKFANTGAPMWCFDCFRGRVR